MMTPSPPDYPISRMCKVVLTQHLADETPVPSPCISLCRMEEHDGRGQSLCAGCYRSLAEIVAWGQSSNDDKRSLWAQLAKRERQFKS